MASQAVWHSKQERELIERIRKLEDVIQIQNDERIQLTNQNKLLQRELEALRQQEMIDEHNHQLISKVVSLEIVEQAHEKLQCQIRPTLLEIPKGYNEVETKAITFSRKEIEDLCIEQQENEQKKANCPLQESSIEDLKDQNQKLNALITESRKDLKRYKAKYKEQLQIESAKRESLEVELVRLNRKLELQIAEADQDQLTEFKDPFQYKNKDNQEQQLSWLNKFATYLSCCSTTTNDMSADIDQQTVIQPQHQKKFHNF
ncbi:hypothetical protein FGO68_gene16836 [Halteria grandinella]|uniref:Uncharacterized protein n=1 Tax=Halteria grandinella TaxID=5974 RepID=A0A8J8NWI5_HALGN|nr:hypothetical protein FGO68_gene16836 [Halteria grandinella]